MCVFAYVYACIYVFVCVYERVDESFIYVFLCVDAVKVPVALLVLEGGPGTLETVDSAILNNTPAIIIKVLVRNVPNGEGKDHTFNN